MGLDVSHDCWSGAYSAFNRWRDKLCDAAGYAFTTTGSNHRGKELAIDWGHVESDWMYGDWPFIPCRIDGTPDPLLLLILHSDCEGKIRAEHTGALADRLTELLPDLEGDGGGHVGSYRLTTQRFIDGLRDAQSRNEDIEFH